MTTALGEGRGGWGNLGFEVAEAISSYGGEIAGLFGKGCNGEASWQGVGRKVLD